MNIFVDENIPRETVDELRAAGHDVLDIRQTPRQGTPDPDLWHIVQDQKRLLITTDTGFTEYAGVPHWGMLIVRLRRPNRAAIHLRVMTAMKQYRPEQWPGLLVVMRDRVKSVRRGPAPRP
jgi:predicted nuclease of predicted toxin-antitoxin system